MGSNDKEELLEILYKENLANKIYLTDKEVEELNEGNPDNIPDDVYFDERKEYGEVVKKYYRYEIIDNCDALLKMKLLKKTRFLSIISVVSIILTLAVLTILFILIF